MDFNGNFNHLSNMKYLSLIILLMGLSPIISSAQTLQRYQKSKISCIVKSKIYLPKIVENSTFKIEVVPQAVSVIRYIEIFVDNKKISTDYYAPYRWTMDVQQLGLATGIHRLKVRIVSICRNSKFLSRDFKVKYH